MKGISAPFRVGFYLSEDPAVTTGDLLVGIRVITTGLNAGQNSATNTPLFIGPMLVPGTYYLGAIVNDLTIVAEVNGSNNVRVAGTIQILISRITDTRVLGADVVVNFTTATGQTYRLERTENLSAPILWTTVAEAANVPGTGGLVAVTNTGAALLQNRFYRVRLVY